ncbi:MAG: hypothetical protein QCI00_10285 [Candidatus Thermoplasmatota archaeon]|nr:hypothetical protein [Candidatus Thermoplasmatota archaeon]
MIDNQDLPTEFVSIRQVWLRQIHRCTEALSNRYRIDITQRGGFANVTDVGEATVIESVVTLYYTLVDFGEATLKTEATKKYDWMFKQSDFNNKKLHYFKEFFEHIIKLLNQYDMLFETKPEGYSNTMMKSVDNDS